MQGWKGLRPGYAALSILPLLAVFSPCHAKTQDVAVRRVVHEDIIPARGKGGAIKVKFGVLKLIAEYYEYNPDTCAEISPGMWTVTKAPKHGSTSMSSGSYTAPSGACASMTYTTAVINYTWTDANTKSKKDRFTADWTTPDGQFDIPESAKLKLVK